MDTAPCLLVLALLIVQVWGGPILHHDVHDAESRPLLPELGSRLAAHQREVEPRLPLPSSQEIEAIKKVAQILIMLGEQVIPTIIGDPPSPSANCEGADPPNDAVNP